MTKLYNSILFVLILSSCASLGTKTIYKKEIKLSLNKIGFTKLEADSLVLNYFPKTDSVFNKTFIESFKSSTVNEITELKNKLTYENTDPKAVKNICAENNLDGLIVSKIKFIHVTYYVSIVPVAKNWDAEIEMKLFDKDGRIILITSHNNTKGNSYILPPSALKSTRDCTKGNIKRIIKELALKK